MNIEELVDNFALFESWEDRYAYLIDLGRRLEPMPDLLKTDASKVKGCISEVWMVPSWDSAGRLRFLAHSNSDIVQGLIAVLHTILAGKTATEIKDMDIKMIFAKLGLDQHLSPNRRNGFFSMVENLQNFAARTR